MGVSRLPGFYGQIDTCACSGYQALLPRREGPGDEAMHHQHAEGGSGLVLVLVMQYIQRCGGSGLVNETRLGHGF